MQTRRADHGVAVARELLLEALDVVHRGHDQHRVAGQRPPGTPPGSRPCAPSWGARRSASTAICGQHRPGRGAVQGAKPRGFAHNARKPGGSVLPSGGDSNFGRSITPPRRRTPRRNGTDMTLCFVDPADAIRAIADSVGREARRQLLGEAVRAWVDEIPDEELEDHYAKAISELDEHDISMLAAWHGSMEVGQPVPNRDFLMGAFDSLGEQPPRGPQARRRLPRRGGLRGGHQRGARARTRARVALAAPPDGARPRGDRALHLGPRRLRQLVDAAARVPQR